MNAPLRFFAACAALCWTSAASARDPEPVFRHLIDASVYSESLSAHRAQIEEAEKLAATDAPASGTMIGFVAPGSTADRLGVVPGMVLTKLGGEPTFWSLEWRERTGPTEAVFLTTDHKEIGHTVPPGLLGVGKLRYFRPELPLIRAHEGSKEEAWYRHAILGAITCETNPALAETAWSMAIGEGYPDDIYSRFYAAMLAPPTPGRLGTSLDRLLDACAGPEGVPLWAQELICGLLAAEGRIPDLAGIMNQGTVYPFFSKQDLTHLQALPALDSATIGGMDPLAYVTSRPFRILNNEMEVIDQYDAGLTRSGSREPFSTPVVAISRPPGYFARTGLRYRSPVKNIHVRLNIAKLGIAGHHEKNDEALDLVLLSNSANPGRNRDGTPAAANVLARASVSYANIYSKEVKTPAFLISAGNLSASWHRQTGSHRKPTPLKDGRTAFGFENLIFDLFRIENEVFVYINGSRYARMPIVEDQGEPGVFFRCVGTSIFFNELTVREYRP